MLNLYRIIDVRDPLFVNLYNLYSLAFPASERRTWADLEYELTYQKNFFANVIIKDETFVGFLNFWKFDRFCYIEHLAVLPASRGKNIGTIAVELLTKSIKLPFVLEVEMPSTPDAIRRINFYERLGFSVVNHPYAQPPYDRDGFLLPMMLMCNDKHFAENHFETIKAIIYTQVYHYKENDETIIPG
jgi:ribosomal protein S18 acetylase RimI-like enzyme